MNTTNVDILRSFYSVTNRNILTEEIYQILLKRWDLDKVDLNEEMVKINARQSSLTKSRRDAVPEFIKLRSILDQKKEAEEASISMNNDENDNELIIGNEEVITNQLQAESMAEIN